MHCASFNQVIGLIQVVCRTQFICRVCFVLVFIFLFVLFLHCENVLFWPVCIFYVILTKYKIIHGVAAWCGGGGGRGRGNKPSVLTINRHISVCTKPLFQGGHQLPNFGSQRWSKSNLFLILKWKNAHRKSSKDLVITSAINRGFAPSGTQLYTHDFSPPPACFRLCGAV